MSTICAMSHVVMCRALLFSTAFLLPGTSGLTEKKTNTRVKSVVRHEQKVEVSGSGTLNLPLGVVSAVGPGARSNAHAVPAGLAEADGVTAVARIPAYQPEKTGAYSLLRHEDVFQSLQHERSSKWMPALMEMHPESVRAYENAKEDRKKVCMPTSLRGESLTKDPKFHAQTLRGRKAMSSKSIVFAGLVRDIGDSASRLFATLRVLGQSFANYQIIIIENNSHDGGHTEHGLQRECTGPNTWCFILDIKNMRRFSQGQFKPNRVRHLTELRQMLLNQVRRLVSESQKSFDFVLMFDGDIFADSMEGGVSQGFHPANMDALFGLTVSGNVGFADDPFDLVCGNQVANWPHPGRYRDTFALRQHSWNEKKKNVDDRDLYFSGNGLLPVKSCFSGMALYSINAINSTCNYTYQDENVCEHVPFHQCLAERGHHRVAIYPPLTVLTFDQGIPPEHCELLMADDQASELQGDQVSENQGSSATDQALPESFWNQEPSASRALLAKMGKVHGSLARATKVKNQTPQMARAEKKKASTGQAKKRFDYNRRFTSLVKGAPKHRRNSNMK